jgi:hypothetical protein
VHARQMALDNTHFAGEKVKIFEKLWDAGSKP